MSSLREEDIHPAVANAELFAKVELFEQEVPRFRVAATPSFASFAASEAEGGGQKSLDKRKTSQTHFSRTGRGRGSLESGTGASREGHRRDSKPVCDGLKHNPEPACDELKHSPEPVCEGLMHSAI